MNLNLNTLRCERCKKETSKLWHHMAPDLPKETSFGNKYGMVCDDCRRHYWLQTFPIKCIVGQKIQLTEKDGTIKMTGELTRDIVFKTEEDILNYARNNSVS